MSADEPAAASYQNYVVCHSMSFALAITLRKMPSSRCIEHVFALSKYGTNHGAATRSRVILKTAAIGALQLPNGHCDLILLTPFWTTVRIGFKQEEEPQAVPIFRMDGAATRLGNPKV